MFRANHRHDTIGILIKDSERRLRSFKGKHIASVNHYKELLDLRTIRKNEPSHLSKDNRYTQMVDMIEAYASVAARVPLNEKPSPMQNVSTLHAPSYWAFQFHTALKTMLREVVRSKDHNQQAMALDRVYEWYRQKERERMAVVEKDRLKKKKKRSSWGVKTHNPNMAIIKMAAAARSRHDDNERQKVMWTLEDRRKKYAELRKKIGLPDPRPFSGMSQRLELRAPDYRDHGQPVDKTNRPSTAHVGRLSRTSTKEDASFDINPSKIAEMVGEQDHGFAVYGRQMISSEQPPMIITAMKTRPKSAISYRPPIVGLKHHTRAKKAVARPAPKVDLDEENVPPVSEVFARPLTASAARPMSAVSRERPATAASMISGLNDSAVETPMSPSRSPIDSRRRLASSIGIRAEPGAVASPHRPLSSLRPTSAPPGGRGGDLVAPGVDQDIEGFILDDLELFRREEEASILKRNNEIERTMVDYGVHRSRVQEEISTKQEAVRYTTQAPILYDRPTYPTEVERKIAQVRALDDASVQTVETTNVDGSETEDEDAQSQGQDRSETSRSAENGEDRLVIKAKMRPIDAFVAAMKAEGDKSEKGSVSKEEMQLIEDVDVWDSAKQRRQQDTELLVRQRSMAPQEMRRHASYVTNDERVQGQRFMSPYVHNVDFLGGQPHVGADNARAESAIKKVVPDYAVRKRPQSAPLYRIPQPLHQRTRCESTVPDQTSFLVGKYGRDLLPSHSSAIHHETERQIIDLRQRSNVPLHIAKGALAAPLDRPVSAMANMLPSGIHLPSDTTRVVPVKKGRKGKGRKGRKGGKRKGKGKRPRKKR